MLGSRPRPTTSAIESTKMPTSTKKVQQHEPKISADDLDRISLSQALRDFEIANARVIDLTARLTATHNRLVDTQHELSLTRVHVGNLNAIISAHEGTADHAEELQARLDTIQRSRSFRLAVLMSKTARRVLR